MSCYTAAKGASVQNNKNLQNAVRHGVQIFHWLIEWTRWFSRFPSYLLLMFIWMHILKYHINAAMPASCIHDRCTQIWCNIPLFSNDVILLYPLLVFQPEKRISYLVNQLLMWFLSTCEMFLYTTFTVYIYYILFLSILGLGICQDNSQTSCTASVKAERETRVRRLHRARSVLGGVGHVRAGLTGSPQETAWGRKEGSGCPPKSTCCCLREGITQLNSPWNM